jgi:hypothetical protein
MDPRLVFDGLTDQTRAAAADFSQKRTVKRYNQSLNNLVSFWSFALSGRDLRALSIGDGVDAVFKIGRSNAFSASSIA